MICPPATLGQILSDPGAVVRLGIAGGLFVGLIWPAFHPPKDVGSVGYMQEKIYFLKTTLIATSIGTAAGVFVKIIGQNFC